MLSPDYYRDTITIIGILSRYKLPISEYIYNTKMLKQVY